MMRGLTCLAVLGSLILGSAQAASGCTSLYASNGPVNAAPQTLGWINAATGVYTQLYAAPAAVTSVNSVAINPVNGQVYYVDRTATTNSLYRYDPASGSNTLVGPVALPVTGAVTVGASFDNSTASPRLFVMYNNYRLQEVNPATGAVVSTMTINIAGTDSQGAAISATDTTNAGTATTSGDVIVQSGRIYMAIDADRGAAGTGQVYYMDFGPVPAAGSTSITNISGTPRRLSLGATAMPVKSVNGISINPVNGLIYVTHSQGGNALATLNVSTGALTNLASTTNGFTDLSDCAVLPDPPTLGKAFSVSSVYLGATATLTLTLGNTNPTPIYTQQSLTDTFPSGLVVAATPGVTSTCLLSSGVNAGPSVVAAAGSSSVTVPVGVRIPQGGCQFTVSVQGSSAGAQLNVIPAGSLNTTAGTGPSASATLTVVGPVSASVQKTQRNVTRGEVSGTAATSAVPGERLEYCLNATHASGTAAATSAVWRDPLDASLTFEPNAYGAGRDIRVQRNGGAYSYLALGSGATLSASILQVPITPFSSGDQVQVCFQVTVR